MSTTATLKMLLLGEDKSASDALNHVGKTLDKTSGQVKHFGDESDQQTRKASGSFRHVAGVMTAAFTGTAVVGFLKDSVQGWADHQQVLRQSAAVIKSTGGAAGVSAKQMDELSGSIESNTGVDGDNILAGENMLATFTNVQNQAGKGNDIFNQATQIMTDMSVATGTDMKGSAIQLGKALNDPIKGVSALSRVGVTFTDQQKKQIATMVEAGDTAGAQRVILHELSKEFGGSAAAQETSGQKMAVAFHNLQDSVGQALLPVITQLSKFLTEHVIPAFQKLIGFVSSNKSWLIPLALAVGVVIVGLKAWAIAQGILNTVMEMNPIALVVIAIAALAAGIIYAYKHSETFRTIIQNAWSGIKTVIMAVWNGYLHPMFIVWKTIITTIGNAALWLWHNAIQPAWNGIKAAISGAWNGVIKPVASAISTAFRAIGDGLSWVWHNVISPVFGWIKSAVHGVWVIVHSVGSAISSAFRHLGDGLRWVWHHIIQPIFHAIKVGVQQVLDALSSITDIGGSALNALTGATGTVGSGGAHAGAGAAGSLGGGTSPRARAGGGRVVGGVPYLVGEERPELFVPDGPGRIVPRVGGGGGGQDINVYVHALSTAQEIGQMVKRALEVDLNGGGTITVRSGAIRTR
jgi:phage-related protein